MFLEGILGVIAASGAIIAVKTTVMEYWAWRARRDLQAKKVLDALAGPYPQYPTNTTTNATVYPQWTTWPTNAGGNISI